MSVSPLFFIFYAFILGSFTTALVYRIPRKQDWVAGRSRCPSCTHKLGVFDLFPVFSWLFLCGKCRYCKAPISIRYPLIECTIALTTFMIAYLMNWHISAMLLMMIVPALAGMLAHKLFCN